MSNIAEKPFINRLVVTFPSNSDQEKVSNNDTYVALVSVLQFKVKPEKIRKSKIFSYSLKYSDQVVFNCFGPRNHNGLKIHSLNIDLQSRDEFEIFKDKLISLINFLSASNLKVSVISFEANLYNSELIKDNMLFRKLYSFEFTSRMNVYSLKESGNISTPSLAHSMFMLGNPKRRLDNIQFENLTHKNRLTLPEGMYSHLRITLKIKETKTKSLLTYLTKSEDFDCREVLYGVLSYYIEVLDRDSTWSVWKNEFGQNNKIKLKNSETRPR